MEFIHRFFKILPDHFFIFGPRGTGKTTWLKQTIKEAYFVDLLDEVTFRQYAAQPDYIKNITDAYPQVKYFVIDEVQRLPQLLNTIHQLIEEKKHYRFIMTGSSARKLKQTGVNLLGGRALLTHFYPYMAHELGSYFNLERALCFGMIPLIVDAIDSSKKLEAYIALYLKEEVHAEGLVRHIGTFSRFLEYSSFSHGSILNINNIARECQTSRKIVENYVSILEDLLLAYRIPVFTKRAKREPVSHPKFYLFDAGVYRTLRPRGPVDKVEEMEGLALEGLVLQHLRAWCDYSQEGSLCYFWRTRGGAEVDFIIYGSQCFYAIEVKNSMVVHHTDLRSLKTFKTDYPESTPLLLYRGKDRLQIDSILCWPVQDFLLQLCPRQWPVS